jgi:hypothetical protein
MTNGREFDKPATYRIRVKGNLEERWSDWFDGFAIEVQPEGETALTGLVADQAALQGFLLKLHNLGLPLLSLRRLQERSSDRKEI